MARNDATTADHPDFVTKERDCKRCGKEIMSWRTARTPWDLSKWCSTCLALKFKTVRVLERKKR